MLARLSLLLLVLMTVVLVSLGVPLAGSVAASEARSMYADRTGDVALFASMVPTGPDAAAERALQRDLTRYQVLYDIPIGVIDAAGRLRLGGGAPLPIREGDAADAVSAALAGRLPEGPSRLWPWAGDPVTAAEPVVRDGNVVGAVVSVSDAADSRRRVLQLWGILAASELVALLGAAFLAGRMARWLLRPIERLDVAAHQIAAGDLGARVPVSSGPPELRRLGGSFNDMAVHVQVALEAQRAFVANAGHQLRNPLAALLVRLEGLSLASPPAEEAVARALEDGRYLADTLDLMLALARAEHTAAGADSLDVGAVVDDRLRFWQVVADRRSILLRRVGAPHGTGWHDAGALAGAVDAVIDNALKYSPEHSTVTVAVDRADVGPAATSGVVIEVRDQGPGLAPEELEHVADRFWRARSTSDQPGSGLGMSIAATLLQRHGGSLLVEPGATGGLAVRLLVPGPPDPAPGATVRTWSAGSSSPPQGEAASSR